MRAIILAAILPLVSLGQVLTPAPESLPGYVAAAGFSLDRGQSCVDNFDVTVAVLLPKTNFYWWSSISTPLCKPPAGSTSPNASVVTTGMAWVAAHSGRVSFIVIGQGGLSITGAQASQASQSGNLSAVAPALGGSLGVSIRVWNNFSIMPYMKVIATGSAASAGGVSTVAQPGIQLQYTFGPK